MSNHLHRYDRATLVFTNSRRACRFISLAPVANNVENVAEDDKVMTYAAALGERHTLSGRCKSKATPPPVETPLVFPDC